MDGTAQFGWGPDWTPWNREGLTRLELELLRVEVTESSDVLEYGALLSALNYGRMKSFLEKNYWG